MQRIIILPATLDNAGVIELKQWLGISRAGEDALLTGLLGAALDLCEAFTGQAPLAQTVEEQMPLARGWQQFALRPVRAIISAELVAHDGARSLLPETAYTAEILACGSARMRLLVPLEGRGVAVRMVAGIASDWSSLPYGLRQGIIRLAAHHYRDRDSDGQRNPVPPPASVTALWHPWRSPRLA